MEIIIIEDWTFPICVIRTGEVALGERFKKKRIIAELLKQRLFKGIESDFLFRGTSYNNLIHVLESGIDVVPGKAPAFFAQDLEKAIHYGWPDFPHEKMRAIFLCYYRNGFERSFLDVPMPIPPDRIADLHKEYPSVLYAKDGSSAWFSKFPMDDSRLGTPNEFHYGYFLSGNPFESLKMIFFVGDFSESEIDFMKIRVKAFKQQSDKKVSSS